MATIQARLLGLSGLLPDEWPASAGRDRYLKSVWDQWWRERGRFHEFILPRRVWRFHGLRPANHPQRRLALAAHWLAAGDFVPRLERWLATTWPVEQLAPSLLAAVQVPRDDFWSWHWTFRSARLAQPQPLLGARRLTDLAVNVLLPWFWIRAVAGGRDALCTEVEQRYFAWPAGEDNAVLRLARQRLLGGVGTKPFRTAAAQQGLLQIVRDFCSHSNAVCEQCRFPELVRGIGV